MNPAFRRSPSLSATDPKFIIRKRNSNADLFTSQKQFKQAAAKPVDHTFWKIEKCKAQILKRMSLPVPQKENEKKTKEINAKEEASEDIQFPKSFGELNEDHLLKKEVKQLDSWAFDNISKQKYIAACPASSPEAMIEQALKESKPCSLPDLDLHLINMLLRESKVEAKFREMALKENAPSISKKIAVTSETINREYNKNLLLKLIQKKLVENPAHKDCNGNYLYMVSKTILVDLVSSFQVLEVFKHQNLLHIKTLLSDSKEPIRQAVFAPTMNLQTSEPTHRSFERYEQALLDNYHRTTKLIEIKKQEAAEEDCKLKNLKSEIESRVERLQSTIKDKDQKETQSVFMRKVGQNVGIQEFIAINELKKEIETQEIAIAQMKQVFTESTTESKGRLRQLQEDIKVYKFRKHLFSIKLREFYLNMLQNEQDLSIWGHSLVEILTSFLKFKDDIKPTMFSSFYNRTDIDFAIKYAKLKALIVEIKQTNKGNQGTFKKLHGLLLRRFENDKDSHNVDSLNEAIAFMKRSNLKMYEKKFDKRSKSLIMRWELRKNELNEELIDAQVEASMQHRPQNCQEEMRGLQCFVNSRKVNELTRQLHSLRSEYLRSVFARFDCDSGPAVVHPNYAEIKKLLSLILGQQQAQEAVNLFKERGFNAFVIQEPKLPALQTSVLMVG